MKIIFDERFFSLEEVGRMMGISKPLVSTYCKERGVKATTINRKKYVTEDGIKKLVLPKKKATV